jgi:Niemann-Pick C1 protein
MQKKNNSSRDDQFCDYDKYRHDKSICSLCDVKKTQHHSLPSQESFLKYIDYFLKQNPSESCVKAGHAMYGNAVKLINEKNNNKKVINIGPTHFMSYHTVLSTSTDFVNAMISANQIADKITKILNENNTSDMKYEVFPYSIFYVFYEQYLTIWQDATMQLILTLVAIFISTFILLSFDLFTALIVTVLIAIIIIDMVGVMFMWNIELNAISLVNLVIVRF